MVKFIPLGGVAGVTKNMFLYETEKEILIIDCGAGFPEEKIDNQLLIPDFSYLRSTRKRILGLVISHAHFDHYGAIPYLLKEFNLPVFGSKLTLAFTSAKLEDMRIKPKNRFVPLKLKERVVLGGFALTPFLVNHSVPEAMGFCLETPVGKIFHVSDYKFDLTPVDGRIFDFHTCTRLSKDNVLALFSDCLGACEEGFTQTEKNIGENLHRLMAQARGQILITTLSSNLFRIRQIIEAARRLDRKVVVLGRSIQTSMSIGHHLGYLPQLPREQRKKLPEKKLIYLVAGSYGQSNSALMQVAHGKHRQLRLKPGAMVIFSADPSPPNTKEKVDRLVDLLTLKGANVHYYEIQENLHVSGHGSAGDIRLLMALVQPQFLIPIGGCLRHMRAYSLIAETMRINRDRVFELLPGETLLFSPQKARRGSRVELKKQVVAA